MLNRVPRFSSERGSQLNLFSSRTWSVSPQSEFDSLTEQGLASTRPVAGLYGFPPQTVFLPHALPTLNSAVQWTPVQPIYRDISMESSAIEQLVAYSTPSRLPVAGEGEFERRNWIVRTAVDVPESWDLAGAEKVLTSDAVAAVRDAATARGLEGSDPERLHLVVNLIRIDRQHLIVRIKSVRLEKDELHVYLVAASRALQALEA
jgi:hypothetical protein